MNPAGQDNNPVDPRHAWRRRDDRTAQLGSVVDRFWDKRYAKPHQQLAELAPLWEKLLPEALASRTMLRSLHRGVLTVVVADSGTLYQLDRALRNGVEQQLARHCAGKLRRVKLEQGKL